MKKRFIIYPKDRIAKIWNVIISIVILYVTFFMTFEIAFLDTPPQFFVISEYISTGIFGIDIMINFNRAYLNKKKMFEVSRKKIAKKYLKTWFFIDLLSFFPFFLFSEFGKFGLSMGLKTLKFLKILNIVRLLRLIKIIKEILYKKFRDPIEKHQATVKRNVERLSIHLLLILITCHLFACIYYAIPLWGQPEKNWIVQRNLQSFEAFDKYLFSMHWMIETMITVGYGENPIE